MVAAAAAAGAKPESGEHNVMGSGGGGVPTLLHVCPEPKEEVSASATRTATTATAVEGATTIYGTAKTVSRAGYCTRREQPAPPPGPNAAMAVWRAAARDYTPAIEEVSEEVGTIKSVTSPAGSSGEACMVLSTSDRPTTLENDDAAARVSATAAAAGIGITATAGDGGEEDDDPAVNFITFLFRRNAAQPCRRKCVQCKRKARRCASALRDEDLALLPPDLQTQQRERRSAVQGVQTKDRERRQIFEKWAAEEEAASAQQAVSASDRGSALRVRFHIIRNART